jgi:hypothetical protein
MSTLLRIAIGVCAIVGFIVLLGICSLGDGEDNAMMWIQDDEEEEGPRESEDPGDDRRCAAFVVIACGDLVVPIPDPGGGSNEPA